MKKTLITNNELVYEKYKNDWDIVYDKDFMYLDVLKAVRDKIHLGHELLTHPLSGSIKPNETPYKTIIISKERDSLDKTGLAILEESILSTEKFLKDEKTPNWNEKILDDFKTIDLSLIESVLKKIWNYKDFL